MVATPTAPNVVGELKPETQREGGRLPWKQHSGKIKGAWVGEVGGMELREREEEGGGGGRREEGGGREGGGRGGRRKWREGGSPHDHDALVQLPRPVPERVGATELVDGALLRRPCRRVVLVDCLAIGLKRQREGGEGGREGGRAVLISFNFPGLETIACRPIWRQTIHTPRSLPPNSP